MWSRRDALEPGQVPWLPPGWMSISAPSQSRAPALYAVTIITCLIAAIFVGTRCYVSIRYKLPMGRDFWMILAAAIIYWAAGGLEIWSATLGLGKHVGDIPILNHLKLKNASIVLPTMNNIATLFVQFSILFFYLKRLSLSYRYRVTTYLIGAASTSFCLVRVVGNTYHCEGDPAVSITMCNTLHRLWYALAVLPVLFDLMIWSLPIPPLLKSADAGEMPQGIRIGVLATLGVGFLACMAPIGRIVAVTVVTSHLEDPSWNAPLVFMCDQLEIGLGIAAACMPSMRRLIGIKYSNEDRTRQNSIEALACHDVLKGDAEALRDMWMQDTVPPPPARRLGGAIHIGPRGHLDLDIEGLGVLDSRLSGTMCQWQQRSIEMNEMKKSDPKTSTQHIDQSPVPNVEGKSTTASSIAANYKVRFDDGEIIPGNKIFSFRRCAGGSSILSQNSSPETEKYFPVSTSKSPLRRSVSEEGLVSSPPDAHLRRGRSSDSIGK